MALVEDSSGNVDRDSTGELVEPYRNAAPHSQGE